MKLSKGFSLAELVIVVGMLGMLALVTMPLVFRYSRTAELNAAATEVKADINAARSHAIRTNSPVCVTNVSGTFSYWTGGCGVTPLWQGGVMQSDGTLINQYLVTANLSSSQSVTVQNRAMEFSPLGSLINVGINGSPSLMITGKAGLTIQVITQASGRVIVQ